MALTKNGKVYVWGANGYGQLGLGDETGRNYETPTEVTALTALAAAGDPVVQLAADKHSMALTKNGKVYAWGYNVDGQLGLGDSGYNTQRYTPTSIKNLRMLKDALPDGLTWADTTLTITDENGADAASRFGTGTHVFDGKNLSVTVKKIPAGQFYLNLRVKVDDNVRGQKLTTPAAELIDENFTIPSNAVYLQSGIKYVTERYLCLGTDTALKEDSLAAVAAGSPYGVDPTLLDDIVDADGATWRYYGYSVDGGATLTPATGAPTGYVHTDTSHALEEGGCPEVSHWNYAIESVAEDSTHRVTYYFVKNVDLKISYREADTTNDVKTPFRTSVGGGEAYVLSASHQESFVDEGGFSWTYANKYSMDGGTRVEEGKPPKALTPPLTEDQHVVLYFTKNPAVTVTLREYSDTAAGRKNTPMLFDRKTNGSSQEVYIITGDSLTPMDKTFVSGAIGSGVYNVSGRGYQYKGYSTDGGATFTEGNPAAMTGIAANTTLTLYFVTREATMPTLPDLGKEYDGSAVETPTVQATGENGAQVDLEYIWEKKTGVDTYTKLTTAPKDAGDYRVTAKVPDSNTDYVGETSKVFTITQKTVTITAKDKSVVVGGTVPSLASPTEGTDYTVEGLVTGDRLTTNPTLEYQKDGVSATPNSTSAGTYAIVAKDADAGDNYTIIYAAGTLTVSSKPSGGGGSDGPTTYPPIIKDTDNGNVTVSPSRPARDHVVIIRPAPDKGYEVEDVVVTKPDGTKVPVKDRGDGTWSYIQPGVRVTVTVTFKRVAGGTYDSCPRDTTCPIWPFKDASTTAWYHDGVHYCIDNGLMIGKSAIRFDPDGSATRGEIVTILWRLEGQPKVEGDSYSDVLSGQYYTEAVVWAAANGIVTGYTDGTFKPDTPITREQMAAILWRYCKYKGIDVSVGEETNILSYNDATTVAEYAVSALQWATGAGVISGKQGGILDPTGSATRAQVATILMRFSVNIVNK